MCDGLTPITGVMVLIYAFHSVFNWLFAPRPVAALVVLSQLVMMAICILLRIAVGRCRSWEGRANQIAAGLATIVFLHVFIVYHLVEQEFYGGYVLIVLVGMGFLILSARWLALAMTATIAIWSTTLWSTHSGFDLFHRLTMLVAAMAVSWIIHRARMITQRRLFEALGTAEAGRLASEERYRQLFESAPDAILVGDQNGNILDANAAACRLHGLEREELIGEHASALLPPGSRESDLEEYRRLATGELDSVESASLAADGRSIPVSVTASRLDYSGQPAVLVHVRDVSRRHEAELALRRSQERLQRYLEMSGDGVVFHRQGEIADANDRFCRTTGLELDEVIGRQITDFVAAGERERVRTRIDSDWQGSYETRALTGEGKSLPVEVIARLVDNRDNPMRVATIRDIRERKRQQEEVRSLERRLAQTAKMEAVGRLAGGVAHDFNNLLTAIGGYAELGLGEVDADCAAQSHLEEILAGTERAGSLTRQLLAFSRQAVLQPQVVNLTLLVSDFESLLQRTLGEDVAVETDLASDLWNVWADSGQLEQVIMNLGINARDAMSDGGRLTIQTRNVELASDATSQLGEVAAGRYVQLTVSDTGCGMDAATQGRVFEPFFTTKDEGKGTGLGLSTVYGIVQQSNGHISISSEPGAGTTIRIHLPWIDEEVQPASRRPEDAPRDEASRTILLTEDDRAVRNLAARVLRKAGYQVLLATCAAEALELSATHQDPIDLLVTDVVMPGMNGVELARRLVDERPDLGILIMSGYRRRDQRAQGLVREGVLFLQKPFSPSDLRRIVAEALAAAG